MGHNITVSNGDQPDIIRLLEEHFEIPTQLPHIWTVLGKTLVMLYEDGALVASTGQIRGKEYTVLPRPLGMLDNVALWEAGDQGFFSNLIYLDSWNDEDTATGMLEFEAMGYQLIRTYPLTYLYHNLAEFSNKPEGSRYQNLRSALHAQTRLGLAIRPLVKNDLEQMLVLAEKWLLHKMAVGQIPDPAIEVSDETVKTFMTQFNLGRDQVLKNIRDVWMRQQEVYKSAAYAFSFSLDSDHYELKGIFSSDGTLLATNGNFKFGNAVHPYAELSPPNQYSRYASRALAIDVMQQLKTEGSTIIFAGCKESQHPSLLQYKSEFGTLHEIPAQMRVLLKGNWSSSKWQ